MTNHNISVDEVVETIFKAIDEVHGSMNASEYKYIFLGLIFLKYLSDRFEIKYQELIKEGYGFEEDRDEYTAENIFFVPPEARWNEIAKKTFSEENGLVIDNAMRFIEKENESLKGVLPKNFSRPELDKRMLGNIIDLVTNFPKLNYSNKKDFLGEVFEKLLINFAIAEGIGPGQFYTPISVVKTLVAILKPYKGRVYDPCCGSGGFFVQSKKFIASHGKNHNNLSFFGQESNSTNWKLANINLAINGVEANLGEYSADTFLNDLHPNLKADYIFADPFFNGSWDRTLLFEDIRWNDYNVPSNNSNYAWILHMIYHSSPKGKIGIVMPNGSLSTSNSDDKKIRKQLIENDLLECVIALPNKLFHKNSPVACLWFLNKNKKQKGKTLFIDARYMGTMVSRSSRILTDNDINLLSELFDKFQEGHLDDELGFYKIANLEDIEKQDYVIVPGRYVGFKPLKDDEIPLNEKLQILSSELDDLFEKSHELEQKISENLNKIMF